MAKRPKPGRCVHCLRHSDDLDWDHVFPRAWYPDNTPPNEGKWKIPSCVPCNRAYGRLEQDFLVRVGLCLDPNDPASRSVAEKAMRSIQESSATSERDRNARAAKRQDILADLMRGAEIPREATYPGMGEKWNRPLDEQLAITIPGEYVQRMTEKIIRGIFYLEDQKLIEPPFEIEHIAVHEDAAQPIRDAIDRFGEAYSRPPGIIIRRAVVPEDGMSSLFEITLWRQFKSYATVLPPHRRHDSQPKEASAHRV